MKKLIYISLYILLSTFLLSCINNKKNEIENITNTDSEMSQVHSHSFSNVYTFDSECHWKEVMCEHEEQLKKEKHDFKEIIINPTQQSIGYTIYRCNVCQYAYADKVKNKVINVYLIAGQSNAVGSGIDTDNIISNSDIRFKKGFDNVLYYANQEWWGNGTYPNEKFEPVKLGYGASLERSGCEIGIASALSNNNGMNAVIKTAWSATHLYPDYSQNVSLKFGTWTSPSYIKTNNVDISKNELIGKMYKLFIETVETGFNLLIEEGYTPVFKGMIWIQGEAEMYSLEQSALYEELLATLILDIRNDLSNITGYDYTNMPFISVLPNWNEEMSGAPNYENDVRNAIISVATNGRLTNVSYIDSLGLNQHDGWHFDTLGQKYLGEQFVEKISLINWNLFNSN